MKHFWTKEEDARLMELYRRNIPAKFIALEFKISKKNVYQRVRDIRKNARVNHSIETSQEA